MTLAARLQRKIAIIDSNLSVPELPAEARPELEAEKLYLSGRAQAKLQGKFQWGVLKGLSVLRGNLHAAFLGERMAAMPSSYPTPFVPLR
jgi:hypothetical protein